jgi:fluoride exporter
VTSDDSFDPDVDLAISSQRRELAGHPAMVLGAISVGGMAGAVARYGIGLAVPHTPTGFPTGTLVINVAGSLSIAVLMVVLGQARDPHPLVRPFFGVGILGGFTTFSTYVVDAQQLLVHHHGGRAALYLVSTLVLGLAAVVVGAVLARLVLTRALR